MSLAYLEQQLQRRILLLDGGMGTLIQAHGLSERAYRGERFADHNRSRTLQGNNDLLNLTCPEIIRKIHVDYLRAGADILETNTFNANAVAQSDYGLENFVYEINKIGARLARDAADLVTKETPQRPRFVAGVLGPTNRTASLSPDVNRPGFRDITFDDLVEAYRPAIAGLMEGGVDLLLVETIFDTLNAKAALFAIDDYAASHHPDGKIPTMISGTITDASGRLLSGQTVTAFSHALFHTAPLSIGLNCALGAKELRPHLQTLSGVTEYYTSVHPNAGLPNAFGEYDETPETMAEVLSEFAREGLVNIVGGCCGTTPAHIHAISEALSGIAPRALPAPPRQCRLSGLEPVTIGPETLFVNVGERTNVSGSRRFARLIREEEYETALSVARDQVENGAQLIDINVDDPMLDTPAVMSDFLNLIASEPEISRVPVMIDSSHWPVLEAGLKRLQGRGIVNSISLKEGEAVFLEQARQIHRLGAAVVVMAFDERGQADSSARKIEICARAYRLLTERVSFPPQEIIFDPNIFAVATGIETHDRYALDFLESVRWIKSHLPGALISGGVSNVSFSFRGNTPMREAMHAVFLYHAIHAGMDMGIVNANQLALYEEIPETLRQTIEDLLLNRRPDATDRLLSLSDETARKSSQKQSAAEEATWRKQSVEERLAHAMIKGIMTHIEEDVEAARLSLDAPLSVIEGPLMEGMRRVGERFGDGRMFLPQVVKSARVMKKAVACLTPFIEEERKAAGESSAKRRILLATVKGDVHDIGKNIVKIILQCNHYEVIDLGIMAPCDEILKRAREEQVDLIGLSGLITPSLEEMRHVASEMDRDRSWTIPLLVGGAATSTPHTAVKIAPCYRGGVTVHVRDASQAARIAADLLHPEKSRTFSEELQKRYALLRDQHRKLQSGKKSLSIEAARLRRCRVDWEKNPPHSPEIPGIHLFSDLSLKKLTEYVDWTPLFHAWSLKGRYPTILNHPVTGEAAHRLFRDAQEMLHRIVHEKWLTAQGVLGLFPVRRMDEQSEDIAVYPDEAAEKRGQPAAILHTLRQQRPRSPEQPCLALADFVAPRDHLGMFAVTVGIGLEKQLNYFEKKQNDDYSAILLKVLADRLVEAFAEWLHEEVRRHYWGYAPEEHLDLQEKIQENYRGIRPAAGYPSMPDLTEQATIFRLLEVQKRTGIVLTENFAMHPAATVCGLYLAHPEARYFSVGTIQRDQLEEYAARKERSVKSMEKWLASNL